MLATGTCIIIYLISMWTVIYNTTTTIFLAIMLALLVAVGLLVEWVVSTRVFLKTIFSMVISMGKWP